MGSAVYVIVLLRGFIPEVFTNACFVSCQPWQVTIPTWRLGEGMHRPDLSSSAAFKRSIAWASGAWRACATPHLHQKHLCWGSKHLDNRESCLCEASIQIPAIRFCTLASPPSLVGVPPKGFSLISLCTYKLKVQNPHTSRYAVYTCSHLLCSHLLSRVLTYYYDIKLVLLYVCF